MTFNIIEVCFLVKTMLTAVKNLKHSCATSVKTISLFTSHRLSNLAMCYTYQSFLHEGAVLYQLPDPEPE